jgi:hypothetical protein
MSSIMPGTPTASYTTSWRPPPARAQASKGGSTTPEWCSPNQTSS